MIVTNNKKNVNNIFYRPNIMQFNLPKSSNHFININGNHIHFQHHIANSSKFMFFIHGYNSHSNYTYIQTLFNTLNDINICTIDLEGHGYSEGERCLVSHSMVTDIVDWITYVMSKNKITNFVILASSFGGVLATLCYPKLHPDIQSKCSAVILMAPAFHLVANTPIKNYIVQNWLSYYLPDWYLPDIFPWRPKAEQSINCPELIEHCRTENLTRKKNVTFNNLKKIAQFGKNAYNNANSILTNLIIIHDPNDQITCYKTSKQLCSNINATLITAHNCKHNIIANNHKLVANIAKKYL